MEESGSSLQRGITFWAPNGDARCLEGVWSTAVRAKRWRLVQQRHLVGVADHPALTRRAVLIGGAGLMALGVTSCSTDGPDRGGAAAVSVADWAATRKAPYFIGHRGAGTVVPEHTLESYLQALDWGAECIEISTARTADGTLICMHDLTYDRTTTLTGRVRDQPSSVLETVRVDIPRLGPRWAGERRPRVPTLQDVLHQVGGRAVLCLEAKDEDGFDAMLEMVRAMGLTESVMIKLFCRSSRIRLAQDAGFSLFVYADRADDLRLPGVRALRPGQDILVLPAIVDGQPISQDTLSPARKLGVELWAYPVVRRSQVTALSRGGFRGFVTPNLGYLAQTVPALRRDQWSQQAIEAGELTPNPYADHYALRWNGDALTVDYPKRPSFVTLGQFCPIERAEAGYRIDVDVCFEQLPSDRTSHFSLAFGHEDDALYRHREGRTAGYHALLRADGGLELFVHSVGARDGQRLASPVQTPPLRAGEWTTLSLSVTPQELRWARGGHPAVTVKDSRFRGGYCHVGRSGGDGPVSLRHFSVAANIL